MSEVSNVVEGAIAGILKPISETIDHITMSGEDRAKLQMQVTGAAVANAQTVLDYEKQLLQGQQDVIKAEASSSNWLASSWRPITALTFLGLVVADSFGWLHSPLAPQAWNLLQIMIGGYTVGRSAEKLVPVALKALSNK